MPKQLFFDDNGLFGKENVIRVGGKPTLTATYSDGVCSTDYCTGWAFRLDDGRWRLLYFGHGTAFAGMRLFAAISEDGVHFAPEILNPAPADGDFAHQLLSPNKKVPKKYLVQLDGEVKPELVEKFREGLTLADGTVLLSATLEILSDTTTAIVTITEGKYHQIKRMFGLFDLGVNELKRISFAGLNLPESLSEGEVRELTVNELECINNAKKT